MEYVHPTAVFDLLRTAVVSGAPYSFIRLGDGEGRVMGFPHHTPVIDMANIWKTWFGHSFYADSQISFLQGELRKAVQAADLVGVPDVHPDPDEEWGRIKAIGLRDGYFGPEAQFCNPGIHLYLEDEGQYPALFEGVGAISVVASRDIVSELRDRFGFHDVQWVRTPPEMRYSDMDEVEKLREVILRPHFVERFDEIMTHELPGVVVPGRVVLVGAGVLGKIYCAKVKALGGVALDLGSMMDLWGRLRTRGLHLFDGLHAPTQ